MNSRGQTQSDGTADRAVSELMGYMLLMGIVFAGAITVLVVGAPILEGIQGQQADDTTQRAMQKVDARLTSLSASSATNATELSFRGAGKQTQSQPKLVTNRGSLTVTVNENSTCSVTVPLDSIRIDVANGGILAYQAGGIWRLSNDGGSVVVTPPTVSIRNGYLGISVMNLTGQIDGDTTRAVLNVTTSKADSRNAVATLLQGSCKRPDNVTVSVTSDFYQGWAEHFQSETGYTIRHTNPANGNSNLTVDDATQTTTLYLNQSALPPRTNDSENSVLDVTNESAYMQDVTITTDGISVTKGAGNNYTVYVQPIADHVEIGTVRRIAKADNVTRRPLDVVFVVDESGSMDDIGPSGQVKYKSVRNAIRNFTTYLDRGYDRVGLVGFHEEGGWPTPFVANVYRATNHILTSNFDKFNSTVSKIKHSGYTYTAIGMKRAHAIMSLYSNETRDKVIVMLSDGANTGSQSIYIAGNYYTDPDPATKKIATLANHSGTTVYTIGFGANKRDLNPDFLKEVANNGGGKYYYAKNASQLQDAFELIARRVSSTKQIGRIPFSTNLTAENTLYAPQITGDVSNIASVTSHGNTYLNFNDPLAPSTFSHSFSISGGEMVNFTATVYGCDKWVATSMTETINGTEYPVTRCADMSTSDKTTIEGSNVTLYTDENSTDFTDMLNSTNSAEWQTNLTAEAVERGVYNASTDQLTLKSNQVLVLYDFPDGKNTHNKMLVLYTVGLSEQGARPTGIIDFEISNVTLN